MTLYTHSELSGFLSPAPFTLNDVQYPRVWWRTVDEAEIEALGFVPHVEPEPEPAEPSTDPADYPLLPWQFKAMVIYLDKDVEVRAFIGQIEDPLKRAAALSRYENASLYEWGDPLMQAARAAIGMSEEDLSAAWMTAKDLRSGVA